MVGGGRFSGGEGDEEEYDWDGDAERQRQRVEAWKRIVNRWWWWSFNGAVFIGVCWTGTIGGLAVGPPRQRQQLSCGVALVFAGMLMGKMILITGRTS